MSFAISLVAGNLFVASLIAVLAWIVGRGGRRSPLAHVLWLAFFVKLVTPPLVPLAIDWHIPQTWQTGSDADLTLALCIVWITGVVFLVVRGSLRFIRFRSLVRHEGSVDIKATEFVRTLLASQRSPQVIRLPVRVSPMLFGFGARAVIVCPDELWAVLDASEREAFLAHEAAHYRRRDHWVRWIEWLASATYWWFPGVYWARMQLERHEEACCDAWAVRKLGSSPRKYAETLLRVVDFISDSSIGIPRLASGMQPTDTLEERLRVLMRHHGVDDVAPAMKVTAGAMCFAMWIVHPVIAPTDRPITKSSHPKAMSLPQKTDAWIPPPQPLQKSPLIEMPEFPTGFWNQSPERQWADFELSLPDARLVAEAGRGVRIEFVDRQPLVFNTGEIAALAEIPQTHRVVIGGNDGKLKLWDLIAGEPVSLIGQHSSTVTSVVYDERAGLISGDSLGSVIRWDLQSGRMLAVWSVPDTPIQSVRFSTDGTTLAILTGSWNRDSLSQRIYFVGSRSLEMVESTVETCGTAVVMPWMDTDWVGIQWCGKVVDLKTQTTIGTIPKTTVSSLVIAEKGVRFLFKGQLPGGHQQDAQANE